MHTIRRAIYAIGIRPQLGSIFYSPSRAIVAAYEDAVRGRLK